MVRCQIGQLDASRRKELVIADEKSVRAVVRKACKGRINVAAGSDFENAQLNAQLGGRGFDLCEDGFGIGRIGRVDEYRDMSSGRRQLMQKFKPLCRQLTAEKIDTG